MEATPQTQLIQFLQQDLSLPHSSIDFALRHADPRDAQLPMILWQYGLITLTQLEQIFDWVESL